MEIIDLFVNAIVIDFGKCNVFVSLTIMSFMI